MEQLAIEQAIYKTIAADVATKGDSLRNAIDGAIIEQYERSGAKTYDVKVNGEKVGSYSVRVSKDKTEKVPRIEDADAFQRWLTDDENMPQIVSYIRDDDYRFLDWLIKSWGVIPDGVEVMDVTHEGGDVIGTTFKVDEHKVADALGHALPTAIAGLLAGE
jgi:hypothetical protein